MVEKAGNMGARVFGYRLSIDLGNRLSPLADGPGSFLAAVSNCTGQANSSNY